MIPCIILSVLIELHFPLSVLNYAVHAESLFLCTEWDNVLFLLTLVSKNTSLLRTEKSLLALIKAKHLPFSWELNVLLYCETITKWRDNRAASSWMSLSLTCGLSSLQILSGKENCDITLSGKKRSRGPLQLANEL